EHCYGCGSHWTVARGAPRDTSPKIAGTSGSRLSLVRYPLAVGRSMVRVSRLYSMTLTYKTKAYSPMKKALDFAFRSAQNTKISHPMGEPMSNTHSLATYPMTRLATALSLAASLVVPGALAQEQAAETQARSSLLEEIVVRARKKAEGEAAQDTPIAMTAFGEAQFKAVFADALGDLGMMSPNVELKPSSQVGNQNFTIRGMGVSGTTPSDSPAVGVFQNGVFWGVNYGSLLDTFDVESVEILRGPQGTLFGRNVTGGAVVVRTKRPDGEFGLDAEAVMGNYGRQDIAVGIQGPLVEGLL